MASDDANIREKLRAEIAKKGDAVKKFLDLVASFEGIIDEEPKRYQAAMKAMKASHGMVDYDVIKAVDAQIAELKNQKHSLVGSLSDKRLELRDHNDTAKDYRDKIEALRKEIEELESKKKDALRKADAIETEIKSFESNYDKVAGELETELNTLKGRIVSYLSSSSNGQEEQQSRKQKPQPQPQQKQQEKKAIDTNISLPEALEKKPLKKNERPCPVCGNPMQFYSFEKAWKCYVCGHDEK